MVGDWMAIPCARVSDVLNLKAGGFKSVGSVHLKHECKPCSFHFTYIKMPDTKPECKASYICEFCHHTDHHRKWQSKFRKLKRPTVTRKCTIYSVQERL